MTELECYWLHECINHKDRYRIDVDNDCVFVTDLKTEKCKFEFNHYGWEFIIDLLRYIGCNVEEV